MSCMCVVLLPQANPERHYTSQRQLYSTPLYVAAEKGHEAVVRLLLQACAAVDQVRGGGLTPFYVAV